MAQVLIRLDSKLALGLGRFSRLSSPYLVCDHLGLLPFRESFCATPRYDYPYPVSTEEEKTILFYVHCEMVDIVRGGWCSITSKFIQRRWYSMHTRRWLSCPQHVYSAAQNTSCMHHVCKYYAMHSRRPRGKSISSQTQSSKETLRLVSTLATIKGNLPNTKRLADSPNNSSKGWMRPSRTGESYLLARCRLGRTSGSKVHDSEIMHSRKRIALSRRLFSCLNPRFCGSLDTLVTLLLYVDRGFCVNGDFPSLIWSEEEIWFRSKGLWSTGFSLVVVRVVTGAAMFDVLCLLKARKKILRCVK